jgi:hypothetical protein
MRQEEIDDIKFPPKEKSLVVEALEESKMRCVAPHLRDRLDKAIRIAEIEHKLVELFLNEVNTPHLTRSQDEKLTALLAEYTEAVK